MNMRANPALRLLGYSDNDRLIIIHTDDIGMCHASIQAYIELMESGLVFSGATMVPCSWFPRVAEFCRRNTFTDMGVHLTLTSEWDNYRWSPISTSLQDSGMLDGEGYFYRSTEEAQIHGEPQAVQLELQAQVNRALSAGIQVTHIDTHMNTVAHPKFVNSYIELALQYKIPFLFPRQDETGFRKLGIDAETAQLAAKLVMYLEDKGVPLVDQATGLDLAKPNERLDYAKLLVSNLEPGITHFIIHPSLDTPELRAITPDWQSRVADYQTFIDDELRQHLNNIGVQVISYNTLKSLIN
jgi:predicted glycoside hydrolase/deacetylase ChbG (UPF0249 family)